MMLYKRSISILLVFLLLFTPFLTAKAQLLTETSSLFTEHTEEPPDLKTEEPVEPAEEPTEPVEEPAEPIEEPTEPIEEPVEPVEEPTEPIEEPVEPVEEPIQPLDELNIKENNLRLPENKMTLFTVGLQSSVGGLFVNDMVSKEDLVERLLGGGVTVSNIKFMGLVDSAGTFSGGTGIIGFGEGIILSTGSIHNVIGPNISSGISRNNGLPGDSSLDTLVSGTRDATVLEFDFIPETGTLVFQYVFASDEYNEYVNSSYNDVFGFFVNGENVALLPGTTTPVSINNVNNGKNSNYYIDNTNGHLNTEMDGLTVVLTVTAQVNAGEINTIKLAIADVGDSVLDSNVFIKAGSFTGNPQPGVLQFSQGEYQVNEEAGKKTITVNRINGSYGNVSIDYATSDGSAKDGIHYTGVNGTLIFENGVTSQNFDIPIINNPIFEGNKQLSITLANPLGGAILGEIDTAILTIVETNTGNTGGSSSGSSETKEYPPQTIDLPHNKLVERMPGYVSLGAPVKITHQTNRVYLDYNHWLKPGIDYSPRIYYWHANIQKWVALATYLMPDGKVMGITDGIYTGWFNVFAVKQPVFCDTYNHVGEQIANRMNGLAVLEGFPTANKDLPMLRFARLDQVTTRGEFIVFLVRTLNINTIEPLVQPLAIEEAQELLGIYSDSGDIPEWLLPEIGGAFKENLIPYLGSTIDIQSPITNAEATIMLSRALKLLPNNKTKNLSIFEDANLPVWANRALVINKLVSVQDRGILPDKEEIPRIEALITLHQLLVYGLGL